MIYVVFWGEFYTLAQNTGFVTHGVMEDRDLNEESNNNLKAENHRHLNSNISSALNSDRVQQLSPLGSDW